jgi:hypothetical protein
MSLEKILLGKYVYTDSGESEEKDDQEVYGVVTQVLIEDYYFLDKNECISIRVEIKTDEGLYYYASLDSVLLAFKKSSNQ